MADLTELVEQLSEHDSADIVKALQDKAHGVWQEVWNAGHANATKRAKDELEAKDAELAAERKAKAKLEADVEKLKQQQPDVAKIREEYQAEIRELKSEHEAALTAERAERAQSEIRRATSDYEARLIAAGLKPVYARVKAKDDRDRFKYEDGELQVLQSGKDIPITPGEGKTAIELLVAEAVKATPAEFIDSKADGGSGAKGNGSGPSSAGFYDQVRATVRKKMEKEGQNADPREELARRRGGSIR